MKQNIFIYIIIFLLFFSCKSEIKNHYSFPESNWNIKDVIGFNIKTEDSTQVNLSNISIRHNTSYKYQNIIFFIHHHFKKQLISVDTIDYELAKNNGKWIGIGKSNIRQITKTILTPKTYQNGLHYFSLELAMRDNNSNQIENLDGISSISFYLSKENE